MMKSSQLVTTIITAIVLAVITYFIANTIQLTPMTIALCVLFSTLIMAFVGAFSLSNKSSTEEAVANGPVEIKTLYVGNLPYRANETAIRTLFSQYGVVHSVRLMKDKNTGKRRGFGFVEMTAAHADKAIKALNDSEFQQRTLKIREAKERPERSVDEQSSE
jgi:RNA recognition motif-containing protein